MWHDVKSNKIKRKFVIYIYKTVQIFVKLNAGKKMKNAAKFSGFFFLQKIYTFSIYYKFYKGNK